MKLKQLKFAFVALAATTLFVSCSNDKDNDTPAPEVKKEINQVLNRASEEPSVLADAVAQQFVQDHDLRLQLLGEPSLDARYELLLDHLDALIASL